ncbi:hypothetical protein AMECASPLE_036538 [Ameca splendens]|uniref:Uncharacterized protein n=1 Tax=Ameca splendens TaxID=208324 RepID=A0ABV0Y7Z7_9TELE
MAGTKTTLLLLKPRLNCHHNVVEGFECSNDPTSYVVWGLNAPGTVSNGKRSLGDRSDKEQFKKNLQEEHKIDACDVAQDSGAGLSSTLEWPTKRGAGLG